MASINRFNPGACDCGVACTIFSDNFDRADGPLGANWTVDAGTIEVASNMCDFDTGTSGLQHARTVTTGATPHRVGCNITRNSTGHKFRLIADASDASNYHFVDLTEASGTVTIAIGKRTGGTDTTLESDTLVASGNLTLCLYVGQARIVARVDDGSTERVVAEDTTLHSGTQAGVGCDTIGTGNARLDNFMWETGDDGAGNGCPNCDALGLDCTHIECTNCDASTTPNYLKVTIPATFACAGTYFAERCCVSSGADCTWITPVPSNCCVSGTTHLQVWITSTTINIRFLSGRPSQCTIPAFADYSKSYSKQDCTTMNITAIPCVSPIGYSCGTCTAPNQATVAGVA